MLRRRIAGTVCSVAFALLAPVVFPSVAAAIAPAATSAPPSSAASSAPAYPAQSPLLTVTSGSVKVGGSVTVTGHGFQGGEVVDLTVTYAPSNHALGSGGPVAQTAAFSLRHGAGRPVSAAHAIAATDGEFSAQVALTQAGNATITATGEQSHMSVVATVSVLPATTSVAATTSTKSSLPVSKTVLLILAGVIVAVLAGVGVLWQRRWRTPSASHNVSTA